MSTRKKEPPVKKVYYAEITCKIYLLDLYHCNHYLVTDFFITVFKLRIYSLDTPPFFTYYVKEREKTSLHYLPAHDIRASNAFKYDGEGKFVP